MFPLRPFVDLLTAFASAMISTSLAQEIDTLLASGKLSRRQIALRVGVGRSTVDAIANGRRGLKGKDQTTHRPLHLPTSSPLRCPQCGYRVYLPCLICIARSLRQSNPGVQAATNSIDRQDIRRKARNRKRRARRGHLRAS
jgi:hypothetical protein